MLYKDAPEEQINLNRFVTGVLHSIEVAESWIQINKLKVPVIQVFLKELNCLEKMIKDYPEEETMQRLNLLVKNIKETINIVFRSQRYGREARVQVLLTKLINPIFSLIQDLETNPKNINGLEEEVAKLAEELAASKVIDPSSTTSSSNQISTAENNAIEKLFLPLHEEIDTFGDAQYADLPEEDAEKVTLS